MKNLRLTLGVAAIALGTFTAFSFAPASSADEDTTGIFYSNPDGTMGDPVVGTNQCQNQGPVCSQEYDLETELPTGNHIKNGVRVQP